MLEYLEGVYKLGYPIKNADPKKEIEYRNKINQLSQIVKSDPKSGKIEANAGMALLFEMNKKMNEDQDVKLKEDKERKRQEQLIAMNEKLEK